MVEMERKVQEVFKGGQSSRRSLLSQLCHTTKSLEGMSVRDMYRVLSCQRKVVLSQALNDGSAYFRRRKEDAN